MFRKLILFVFLLSGFNSFSQNVKEIEKKLSQGNNLELSNYIIKVKQKGLSLEEAEKQLIQLGGKASEIKQLRDLWDKEISSEKKSLSFESNENSIESKFGDTEKFKDSLNDTETETVKKIKRFGSEFFDNRNIVESPQLFIATPSSYQLGPGDELIINIYGASENTYEAQISRNGNIKLDKLAPIYLSGLSIKSAAQTLKNRLSKIYTGLYSNSSVDQVFLELSLKKARSIVVNITGQVKAPGTYTISGFSSVLNAIYAAGGPNEIGTYRDIKVLRNGKLIYTVDLYDYFTNGISKSLSLRDQDVILVQTYKVQVEVEEGFKQVALYEMKLNETISDLLIISGGPSSDSYSEKLFIERFDGFSKAIFEVSKKDFSVSNLFDGDLLHFKKIDNKNITGTVKIGGAVFLDGKFDISKNQTVQELIKSSKGYTKNILGDNAILFRNKNGLNNESISINLKNSNDLKIRLVENDSLYIPSSEDILFDQKIEVRGEINFPKKIDYRYGLTISDLIIFSGGLTPYANKKDIRIFRNISNEAGFEITEEIIVELDEENIPNKKVLLLPDDIVTFNTYPYRKENRFYSIDGEVALPGIYSIKNQNYSVYDAIKENIKFLNTSSIDGISIIRDSIQIPVEGNKLISQGKNSKYNFQLNSDDTIVVPAIDNTVYVYGEVQQEGIINITKPTNAKSVIKAVGGFTSKSLKKEVYVEYQNGFKKVTSSFLFFKFYPKAPPGSKVFVPEKDENLNKTTVGDIVGYTTSLISVFAIIKSL